MSNPLLDAVAREVGERYFASPFQLAALGSCGGFSGASLWRVECAGVSYCLKAWPPVESSLPHMQWVHELMIQAGEAGLLVVPRVIESRSFRSVEQAARRLWDLTTWMPGKADFHDQPTVRRLEAAATTLARLHRLWWIRHTNPAPIPAVKRRLTRAQEWRTRVETGWRPCLPHSMADPVKPWFDRAWELLTLWATPLPRVLEPCARLALPLQPCHGDLWSDHMLFEGNDVSAIIDFGSARVDHVAVDLARLIGSLVEDDKAQRQHAISAYAKIRPLEAAEEMLVHALDITGTIVGLMNWVTWLDSDTRAFANRKCVAARLSKLVRRVEHWDLGRDALIPIP